MWHRRDIHADGGSGPIQHLAARSVRLSTRIDVKVCERLIGYANADILPIQQPTPPPNPTTALGEAHRYDDRCACGQRLRD